MSSLSENKIIEILSEVYNVDKKCIKHEVVEYFKNIATSRVILSIRRTPKGIPFKEILENGGDVDEIAKQYGITSDVLNRRLQEYQVVTNGFDVKLNSIKRRKVDEEEYEL